MGLSIKVLGFRVEELDTGLKSRVEISGFWA